MTAQIGIDATVINNVPTGAGQVAVHLLKALASIDSENFYSIFVQHQLCEEHPVFALSKYRNFEIYRIKAPAIGPRKHLVFAMFLANCKKFDIFHSLNGDLPLFQRNQSVVTIHDLKYILYPQFFKQFYQFKYLYLKATIKLACQRAKIIIVPSNSTKRDIQRLYKVSSEKIIVTPWGPTVKVEPKWEENKKRLNQSELLIRPPYILFVGELRPHKNVEGLLMAFALFKERWDRWDTRLVIVGKKYKGYKAYEGIMRSKGLEDWVSFPGLVSQEQLVHLYKGASVFILPSLYEGFGLPVLEAMQLGVPVITSNVSSLPEVAGNSALLVDPYNPEHIAEALAKLMSDPNLRNELVRRGYERVKQFSWEAAAHATLQAYKRICSKVAC